MGALLRGVILAPPLRYWPFGRRVASDEPRTGAPFVGAESQGAPDAAPSIVGRKETQSPRNHPL
jgi:hypothetical protein